MALQYEPDESAWIIRNLKKYGNALIPNELIDNYGIVEVCRMIFLASRIRVRIRKANPTIFKDTLTGHDMMTKAEKKPLYIADVC